MKFTYLLLNVFTISVPLLRSFENRIAFHTKWKYFFPANLITSAFFLIWDYFKTKHGVWGFNDHYILGIKFFGLPLEEFLFFITVPYACTFIYESVILFVKYRITSIDTRWMIAFVGLASLIGSCFVTDKAYTFSVLLILGLQLPLVALILNSDRIEKLILTYIISILPMLIVNGILTYLPVVTYNNDQNLNFRIGSIPVEDFIYNAILLTMTITLYEWQISSAKRKASSSPHNKKYYSLEAK